MNCKLKKIIIGIGVLSYPILMVGCTDGAKKSLENVNSLILQGKDFNGALQEIDKALEKYPDNSELLGLKDDISVYLTAKDFYYDDNLEEALGYINEIENEVNDTVLEEPCNTLRERILRKEEKKASDNSESSTGFLDEATKISSEIADFSVSKAFEIFEPYKEISPYEDEYEKLLSIKNRTIEEENRLKEVQKSILGAATISKNIYEDSNGIFRVGNQYYLADNGECTIYKVYKNGIVEKIK